MAAPPGLPGSPRDLVVLGSTGALGRLALAEALAHPARLRVTALGAGHRVGELADQALAAAGAWGRLPTLAVADEAAAADLRARLRPHGDPAIHVGSAGLASLAGGALPGGSAPDALVLCAIAGLAAWPAVEAAAAAGRSLVVSSKEVLVVAGAALARLSTSRGGSLRPLDSELSAAAVLLARFGEAGERGGGAPGDGGGLRLLLTASGGPLWARPGVDLAGVTPAAVLHHPVWPLGPKIAVDSATQVNKAHEVVAASQLFGIPAEAIQVAIHPEARIHAVLGLPDGTEIALAAPPDMRVPLRALLGLPAPAPRSAPTPEAWCLGGTLSLLEPDVLRFHGVTLGHRALEAGAGGRAALAGADEAAVAAFLEGRLPFLGIAQAVARAIAEAPACGEGLTELREAATTVHRQWAHRLGVTP